VPTQAALSGNFSALESAACQSSGRAVTLTDPTTGQPFPNNVVPVNRFVKPALNVVKNIPVSADPCGKLVYAIPNPLNDNQWIGKIDWLLSTKHNMSARYFVLDLDNPPIYQENLLTTTRAGLADRMQTITVSDQYSFTPTIVNAVHVTFNRLAINRAVSPDMPGTVGIGVNVYNAIPNYMSLSLSNRFSVGGGS